MIIVVNMTGLGSRIKNVVSALRMGHVKNDLILIEPEFEYHYLFNIQQLADRRLFNSHWFQTWMLLDEDQDSIKLIDPNKKTIIYTPFQNYLTYHHNIVDFQYDNIKPDVIDKWLFYFDLLKWSPYVLDEAERLFNLYDLEGITGVHIRSWYDVKDKQFVNQLYDIKQYANMIESLEIDRIFLCADHINVVNDLKNILDSKIKIITRDDILSSDRHVEKDHHVDVLMYAGIDLQLLGRCKTIIGSYQSNFTELAWYLGKCKPKIMIPQPKNI